MNDSAARQGTCLCGAVTLTVNVLDGKMAACHCSMCRKWAGGPFLAVDCRSSAHFDGDEFVSEYDSSEWAQRGFCSRCGTHLYYRLKSGDLFAVPVGLLDDPPNVSFTSQIFIDEKPDYYAFANDTVFMTGAEMFAKYAPDQD